MAFNSGLFGHAGAGRKKIKLKKRNTFDPAITILFTLLIFSSHITLLLFFP